METIHKSDEASNNTTTNNNGNNISNKKGIDIQEALSILSLRAQKGSNKDHALKNNKLDPELKRMGQTINFMTSEQDQANTHSQENPLVTQEREETAKQIHERRKEETLFSSSPSSKSKQLKDTLSEQSPSSLLQTLFQLQQQRVSTYQKFNSSLQTVLQSKNFSNYTSIATNVTATFVVISNSMKEIQRLFVDKHGRKDVSSFIKKLQGYEKDKLHLTAALHLERMRECNDGIDFGVGGVSGKSNNGLGSGNEKIAALLRESILSLQGKIADCIENINEIMEELRYVADDI